MPSIGIVKGGLTYKPSEIIENGIPVLRSTNIVNGKIILNDLVRVNSKIRDSQYMETNDILICARNGSKALVGKCAVFDIETSEKYSFGAFMLAYKSPFFKYVYYYLNSYLFRNLLNKDDTKQINQVTLSTLYQTLIPFPPIKEQEQITTLLDRLMSSISTIEVNKNKIESIVSSAKKKILDNIFGENSSYKSYYEKQYALDEVLPYEQPGPYIVKSTNYDDSYETPVLTPGKSFILGYTNETEGIYDVKNSKVIIFDDFTTASRLIGFNFKVKSSAMKILKSSDHEMFNIHYLYYLLKTIYINTDTHKRYWVSEYAPIMVNIHQYDEQLKIVDSINQAYELLDQMIESNN